MDGIRNTMTVRDHATLRMLLVAVALLVSPLLSSAWCADAPVESSRRLAMKQFDQPAVVQNSIALDSDRFLSNPPATIRPPARLVDARNSPLVAAVSGVESDEVDRSLPSQGDAGTPSAFPQPEPTGQNAVDALATTRSASDQNPTVEEALQMRGSVTFRKTPISEVVFLLSDLWKINIVAGADVTGEVSGAFQNAPLSEVLSAALTASGFGYRQIGSSLVVLPIAEVENAPADTAGSAGAAAVDSFAESGIAYFSPQFTEAEQMAQPLQTALGPNVVVAVYPEENRIMVKGSAPDLRIASEAIQQLDVPRPQVRITAMIYDVSLGELERLGVTWNRQVRELANAQNEALGEVTNSLTDFFAASSDLTGSGATVVGIRTINDKLSTNFFLEALDASSEAKLLADPSITVGDRTQASIRIVQQIPIVGANPVEGSNAVFTQTEFKEAGVILNVLPRISRDGTIQLQVQPEYSVVSEITSAGPVIDTRTADTIVRVNNGQMFVLGGLRQKSIVESVNGVPYLRELKWIGKLFRAHSTEVRESELIVFLKPELITPYYSGHPREQMAACVASDQLDRIPHAQVESIIPCCKDPLCPNHHPRARANLGSYTFEMIGGTGLGAGQIVASEVVEISGDEVGANAAPVEFESQYDDGLIEYLPAPTDPAPTPPGPPALEAPTPVDPVPPSRPDVSRVPVGRNSFALESIVVEDIAVAPGR